MHKRARGFRMALVGMTLALALGACAATFDNHGYVPPAEELAQLRIGSSRADVAAIIGTPGAAGMMRDEAWFYTAYRMRNQGYRAPQVIERQIIAVSFDAAGQVSNIEEFGLEDGRIVQLSRRVITSSVREVTFFGQLFSNFGRINLGEALSD